MTRAEKASIAYQLVAHGPRVMGGDAVLSDDDFKFWNINYDFVAGYKQAEKDLGWHSVDESLPPMNEEVIVLLGNYDDLYEIAVGHIVDKEIAVDYNGWDIPGVKYWMPRPKIPKEEKK